MVCHISGISVISSCICRLKCHIMLHMLFKECHMKVHIEVAYHGSYIPKWHMRFHMTLVTVTIEFVTVMGVIWSGKTAVMLGGKMLYTTCHTDFWCQK